MVLRGYQNKKIIKAVLDLTETITERYLYAIKQQIKRESYQWYKTTKRAEYIHEFRNGLSFCKRNVIKSDSLMIIELRPIKKLFKQLMRKKFCLR